MRQFKLSKRNIVLAAIVVILLLVATGLGLHFGQQNQQPNSNDTPQSLAAGVPSEDMAKIPIYPNATPVELPPNERGPGTLNFHVTANLGDIQTFYENALLKNGWSLYYTWSSNLVEYVWQDPKLALPYLMHLTVYLVQGNVLLPRTVVDVQLTVSREPDPNNVPLMTGAQSVQSKDEVLKTQTDAGLSREDNVRTISYLTDQNIDDVLAYYGTILSSYGWRLDDPKHPAAPTFHEGITYYYYSSGGGEGGPSSGAIVNIVTTPDTSDETKVQLRIAGNRLRK